MTVPPPAVQTEYAVHVEGRGFVAGDHIHRRVRPEAPLVFKDQDEAFNVATAVRFQYKHLGVDAVVNILERTKTTVYGAWVAPSDEETR